MIREISDQTFEQEVLRSDIPVVVDFCAPWCDPCRVIAPLTEKLSEIYAGKIKFCKLNVDENPFITKKYGIRSIPLMLFFKGGQEVDQFLSRLRVPLCVEYAGTI
jgi:thioredoxin 1